MAGKVKGFKSRLKNAVIALFPPIKKVVERKTYYEEAYNALVERLKVIEGDNPSVVDFGDGLYLRGKNVTFLDEQNFQEAYTAGERSGHNLGNNLNIRWRVHVALWAASQVRRLPGDFVECGVSTGILSLAICKYIDFNNTDKHFYLFDTFEGIPVEQGASQEEKAHIQMLNDKTFESCYSITKKNFAPYKNAVLVKGRVPDTLDTVKIDQVGYLHIDMNVAKPERDALEFFWPKMVSGGIILMDDYGLTGYEAQHAGANDFVEKLNATEAYRENKVMILALPTGQGLIIKP